ncbi:NAD(P)H-binding protein [Salinifilum aidingensis]
MTNPILVTGATGTLGSALVDRLLAAGHAVRVLSRTPVSAGRRQYEWAQGDLRTDTGLDAAVGGTGVIVHCATANGRGDVLATRNLIRAARGGGRPHLVYVSIVGCDRIPLPYYRAKVECEQLVESSELPFTILRATQFHDLLATFFAAQRHLPCVLVPAGMDFQPVDVRDVAEHLTGIAERPPAGRVPDIGGPEVRALAELARAYRAATGRRRIVLRIPLPGKIARGYRRGEHLAPERAPGSTTFDEFLADPPGGRSLR